MNHLYVSRNVPFVKTIWDRHEQPTLIRVKAPSTQVKKLIAKYNLVRRDDYKHLENLTKTQIYFNDSFMKKFRFKLTKNVYKIAMFVVTKRDNKFVIIPRYKDKIIMSHVAWYGETIDGGVITEKYGILMELKKQFAIPNEAYHIHPLDSKGKVERSLRGFEQFVYYDNWKYYLIFNPSLPNEDALTISEFMTKLFHLVQKPGLENTIRMTLDTYHSQ